LTAFRDIFRRASLFSLAEVAVKAVQVVRGLVVARVLGPQLMGEWQALMLVFWYGGWLDLGLIAGVGRHVSQCIGAGQAWNAVPRLARSGFLVLWACLIPVVTLVMGVAGLPFSTQGLVAGVWLAVLLLLDYNLQAQLLRARMAFGRYALCRLALTASECVFGIAGAYLFGIPGLVAALLVSYAVQHNGTADDCPPLPSRVSLLRLGFPLFLTGIMGVLLFTVDRLFIALFLPSTALGLYAVSLTLAACAWLLPQQVSLVLLHALQIDYGNRDGAGSMVLNWRWGHRLVLLLAVPLCYWFVPVATLVVRGLLPEFVGAEPLLLVLGLGAYWFAVTEPGQAYLAGARDDRRLVTAQVLMVAAAVLLNALVLSLGGGVRAVAAATVLVRAGYALFLERRCAGLAHDHGVRSPGAWRTVCVFLLLVTAVTAVQAWSGDLTRSRQFLVAAGVFVPLMLISLPLTLGPDLPLLWRSLGRRARRQGGERDGEPLP
jgi:O-antigen/teichoic acid export membrane protein